MKLTLSAVVVGLAVAVGTGGLRAQVDRDDASDIAVDAGRVVSGETVDGRLAPLANESVYWGLNPCEGSSRAASVYVHGYGCGPSPISVPTIYVMVTERSNFQIEVLERDHVLVESYDFVEVDRGAYLFVLDAPLLPKRECLVRLKVAGESYGEARSNSFLLNALFAEVQQ